VAADQEGGEVQVLFGAGFSDMPPATEQSTMTTAQLQTAAQGWGRELHRAGVNIDLAPVADVLLPSLGARNTSVGVSRRTYGTEPAKVSASVLSVAGGLRTSGVDATVKHFPGLGQVAPNTDFSADVRDTTTGPTSPNLQPFRAAVAGGVSFVMVSSAIYTKLDRANPAVFSGAVISGLLRRQIAFSGVVVSDDLGNAAAVRAVKPADRATRFVAAGGDLVLTVDPQAAIPMLDGLTALMSTDTHFAQQVDGAVRRVLDAKSALGLLHC
jgi:beta-N-acetylhexosaminidase